MMGEKCEGCWVCIRDGVITQVIIEGMSEG